MNICWQNVYYPDITLGGGGARNSRHISHAMRKAGHEVKFLSETRVAADVGPKEVYGAEVLYYLRPQWPERLWLLRGVYNLHGYKNSLREFAPGSDAYFCNDPEIVPALKFHGEQRPVIARVEGTRAGDRASWNTVKNSSPKDRLYRTAQARLDDAVSRHAWKLCDALLVKSRIIKEELIEWYGMPAEKIATIPNGVDYEHFASSTCTQEILEEIGAVSPDEVRIIFVGRLSLVKNLGFLMRAFVTIKSTVRMRLVIVGDGSEADALHGQAKSLGIADRIAFLGHKDNIAPYLRACHIFALPSQYETIANCLLEAMAAGLPCVALRPGTGNVRTSSDEVIKDGVSGFLPDGNDPLAMAAVLTELVQSQELRHAIGQAGQKIIKERFSWENCARQYIDLAAECSEKSPNRMARQLANH